MAYKIVTTPNATRDISKSFEYYKGIAGNKIANQFFQDLKNTTNKLKEVAHFQKIYDDFHRLPLKIFPYI